MARVWIEDRADHAEYQAALAKYKAGKGRGRRNPPGRWRVRWYDPAGKERSKTFGRKPDAEDFQRDTERGLAGAGGAVYVDPKARAVPLANVAESWFIAKSPSWGPRTKRNYREILDGYVIPRFGSGPAAAVGYEEAAAWLAGLLGKPGLTGSDKRKIGASRLRGIHLVLSGVLDWAAKAGRIQANPIARLDTLPSKPASKRRYLTHEQVDVLAGAVGSLETAHGKPKPGREMYRVMVLVLAYCGLRIGEALALKAGAVDLADRRLHVVEAYGEDEAGKIALGLPKGGKTRVVGLPAFLAEELKPYVEGQGEDALVFTSPRGDAIRAHNFRPRIFASAVDAAELPAGLTPHSLRHTFASLSVAAGADVKTLQAAMGHASAAMTLDVYADLFPARVGEVADALGSARDKALIGSEEDTGKPK
ncbi:MAG: tyrosine-type recombinase/integrase [Stackebrandtia sp.]